jgi:prevent-host-death family protein
MTQTINVTEARAQLSEVLNKVYREETRIVIEKSGIPVAAVISTDDLERFTRMEAQRAERFTVLNEIGAAFKDVPPEEIEREVAKALAEVREENRQPAK